MRLLVIITLMKKMCIWKLEVEFMDVLSDLKLIALLIQFHFYNLHIQSS